MGCWVPATRCRVPRPLTLGEEINSHMKTHTTNIIAFSIMVLLYSIPLLIGGIWSQAYIKHHSDKPGMNEIRAIAKENNLKHTEVGNALRPPREIGLRALVSVLVGQTVFLGFTLGLFELLRRFTSRFSKQTNKRAQQRGAGYPPQGVGSPNP